MKAIHLLCLLGILLLLPVSLYARDDEGWTMTNFNNENGLPQNSIRFVQMDNDGYLWLATQAGIVRYDGQRFRLFDNANSALRMNRYWMLGKDDNGHIYCLDDALEMAFYNSRTGFSKPVPKPSLVPATDGGLIDLGPVDMGKLAPLTNRATHNTYPDAGSFVFHATGKGRGFVVWNYYLAGYLSNGKVHRVDTIGYYPGTNLAIGCVGGKLCYIGKNKDFVLLDSNGVRRHQKIPFAVPWDKLKSNSNILAFFKQERQALFHTDGDIYEVGLNNDELEFRHLVAAKDIPHIACARYYPEQNLLAVGSNTRGLFLFKKRQFTSVGKNAANADAFYALAPYGSDQVIATSGRLPNSPEVPGIVDAINRFSILRDRNKHYWYASGSTLLQTDDLFRVLKRVPLLPLGLYCVQEDEQGTIWLSQGRSEEFGRIQGDTFQLYKLDSLEGKGLKTITTILPAGNQTLWLLGYRLCLWLDVKHRRQRIYHAFDHVELRTGYIDKKGNLWVGSYGQGYYLFLNGRFIKMPEDRTHALSIVHCFLEDSKGSLWMTTNNGLFQCAAQDLYDYAAGKKKQVYHHYYGKESGLKVSEFNGGCTPSGLKLDNGSFAFPSMEGVVRFHPDSIQPALPVSKLFIENVLLDDTPVNEAGLSGISPYFKRLELTVSSPYFGNPNNLNIEYNLDGLDDRWYPLGENSRIVLNRLKYGHYKLRLRKEAGFGSNNYVTAELPLVVLPFFHQTWWFRILVAACIILLIVVVIRIRYQYLIRQRNRLEAEVKDRTSALVYNNKLMEKLTVMIAHDLKSPLYFLSKVTGHLRSNVQQENLQEIDRTSSEIKHTADQVYQFIEGFNLWASSFTEGFVLNKAFFPLEELLQELGLFFKEMLEANGNRLFVATPSDYILHTDRELLKVILRNIIDNANKHTQACDISISVQEEAGRLLSLTIADTGGGMSKPVLKRIQDRIALASTAAGIERNSRLGYQMIIDFTTRLGARLEVLSEQGKGTSVTLLHLEGKRSETSPAQDLAEQIIGAG
jgi:signal transduction histidine kinase